ncbi:MAG: AAA family ATPase [Magnetococcales bacterium]|nr:AAA family ATPase [Magnetococcales bacterium]
MVRRLTLKNFKSFRDQSFDFDAFGLLVGGNNSGKSTILQALAIWQYCVDLFGSSSRQGSKGIQVVLPNFTALPIPEFNLLWPDRTDRIYPKVGDKREQKFILIHIGVSWLTHAGESKVFDVELRYHSPQTMYAIPVGGWGLFNEVQSSGMPRMVYIPPFSGLEPMERALDPGPVRQQVGKGQPGSVLRNLLLQVVDRKHMHPRWDELADLVRLWFSVRLNQPIYDASSDVYITVEYEQNKKKYDIISGGSGFHQTLTLLAFYYGYDATTILIDEPDAHLHVNLQRAVLDFCQRKSLEDGRQFLIATHAEAFIRGVAPEKILSLLDHTPRKIDATETVVRALAEITNEEIADLRVWPFILYVEGESDERTLRAWAKACGAESDMDRIRFRLMHGGNKGEMKRQAESHFQALRQVVPAVRRLVLFDFDTQETAFHPPEENPILVEWKRKNIENYLLVPDAWKRVVELKGYGPLFDRGGIDRIDQFFVGENLTLPPGQSWRTVSASIFRVVDGKRLLFENDDSLFHQLRRMDPSVVIPREDVARAMLPEEIHADVHQFFDRLKRLIAQQEPDESSS